MKFVYIICNFVYFSIGRFCSCWTFQVQVNSPTNITLSGQCQTYTNLFLNFFIENLILTGVWFDLHIRLLFSNLSMWDVDLFLNNPPLKSRTFGPLPAKLWHLAPALLIHEIFLTHFSNRVILRAPPIPSMQPTPTFIGLLFDIGSDINWTFQGQVNSFVSMILSAFPSDQTCTNCFRATSQQNHLFQTSSYTYTLTKNWQF